jgi:hypothetical protein
MLLFVVANQDVRGNGFREGSRGRFVGMDHDFFTTDTAYIVKG